MINASKDSLTLCLTDAVKLMNEDGADECKYKIGEADGLKFSLYIEPIENQETGSSREIAEFEDFTYNCVYGT